MPETKSTDHEGAFLLWPVSRSLLFSLSAHSCHALVVLSFLLDTVHGGGIYLCNLAGRRTPVPAPSLVIAQGTKRSSQAMGYSRNNLDAELAEADAEELQQPRLARVQDVALLADDVALAGAALVAEDDLALDHAGGDA